MDYITDELSAFNFNRETNGFKYLIDTIYEIISRKNINFDLENDIYYRVSKINKKKPIQIKWAIDKTIASMFINTNYNTIQRYFGFVEYQKPTTKSLIRHIVHNYYEIKREKIS